MIQPIFLHVDLDAFYASVEQLDNPEYRGKPVIVGGKPTDLRGVVSTCSYEARAFGVHSAMPVKKAYALCPQGIFLRGRMQRYHEKSREVMKIFCNYSPEIQQLSIDEAFIDITGTERLFGNPEHTARQLKHEVLEKTGLTISVGVASNKYIAKIASGLSKPDGLYSVPVGDEEKFILSLPLKKLWGVGKKTLERIQSMGFYKPQDLYLQSLSRLQDLFGKATGQFLFTVLRGGNSDIFKPRLKNKSISTEKTFETDIIDEYVLETILMELAWDVMFRLITEGFSSATVQIKIRYEDFTTVSIQSTHTLPFNSAEELFQRAKDLFYQKYQRGRPVRLLGIAAEHLSDTDEPVQKELFDFDNKKQQQIEKTVINLQKKKPNIHITKARFLKILLLFVFVGMQTQFFTQPLPVLEKEDPIALFQFTEKSPQVEFFARGSWEGKFIGAINFFNTTGNGGNNSLFVSITPPVFLQTTNMSVWFFLKKTWYFEATINEPYYNSTVAAGYYGKGVLRHVRIGNKDITFPDNYGIYTLGKGIAGGIERAPGIMAEWQGKTWDLHAVLRLDMLESRQKTWVGGNELQNTIMSIAKWQRGLRFVLPTGLAVTNIKNIYVEKTLYNSEFSGSTIFTDVSGKEYVSLSASEYFLSPHTNSILLKNAVQGRILVDFYSYTKATLTTELGEYNIPNSFLGNIQKWFGSNLQSEQAPPDLKKYSYAYITKIGSGVAHNDALVIQNGTYFSPFADSSIYAIPNTFFAESAFVYSDNYETKNDDYSVNPTETFFSEFHTNDTVEKKYLTVWNKKAQHSFEAQSLQFPFADKNPEAYLQSSPQIYGTGIVLKSALTIHEYTIGTTAIQGTIKIYRNGARENRYTFNKKTGTIHFFIPPTAFDTISVYWQEEKTTATKSTFTSAIGFTKHFSSNSTLKTSLAFLFPVINKKKFTYKQNEAETSLTQAITYAFKNNTVDFSNVFGVSIIKENISDYFRLEGMDTKKPKQIMFQEQSLTQNNTDITLYHRFDSLQDKSLLMLNQKTAISKIIKKNRTTLATFEWENLADKEWAYQDISLENNWVDLSNAENLLIEVEQLAGDANYTLYVQIGELTEQLVLDKNMPTWNLRENIDVSPPFNLITSGKQKIQLHLRDSDRARIKKNSVFRLVVVNNVPSNLSSGKIEVSLQSLAFSHFQLYHTKNVIATTDTVLSTNIGKSEHRDMERFTVGTINTVQKVEWSSHSTLQDKKVTIFKKIEDVLLADYKRFGFFIYAQEFKNTDMTIFLQGKHSQNALALKLKNLDSTLWHKIEFDFETRRLFIDEKEQVASAYNILELNTTIPITVLKIELTPNNQGQNYNGTVFIDEFYLNESIIKSLVQNQTNFAWNKTGNLLAIRNFPIFSNPMVATHSLFQLSKPFNKNPAQIGFSSDFNGGLDILFFRTGGYVQFSFSNDVTKKYLHYAGHSFKTLPLFLPTQIAMFSEEYFFSNDSKSSNKIEQMTLNLFPVSVPLKVDFSTHSRRNFTQYNQNVSITTQAQIMGKHADYRINTELAAEQDEFTPKTIFTNYENEWLLNSKIQFSGGSGTAQLRKTRMSVQQQVNINNGMVLPALTVSGEAIYNAQKKSFYTFADILRFEIPFTVKNQQFSVMLGRNALISQTTFRGGDYSRDADVFFKNFSNRAWAYKSPPLYDFFDTSLAPAMQKRNDTARYDTHIRTSWKRPLFITIHDLYVPNAMSIDFSRMINTNSANINDVRQMTTDLKFIAINNFGQYGVKPLFMWYEQDEIIYGMKFNYKKDVQQKNRFYFLYSGYAQLQFFIKQNNSLAFFLETSADTNTAFSVTFKTRWERNGKSSILLDGLLFLFPSIRNSYRGIERKNEAYIRFNKTVSALEQAYGINHSIQINVTDQIKLATYLGVTIDVKNRQFQLTQTASISAKISF